MSLLFSATTPAARRGKIITPPGDPGEPGDPGQEPSGNLLGVGSLSTSYNDYPVMGPQTDGDIFVDPQASTNGNGSEGSPFNDLIHALSVIPDNNRMLVKAGVINLTSQIIRNTSWSTGIEVFAYGDDRPVIDASSLPSGNDGIAIWFRDSSEAEHWKGFEIIGSPDMAFLMSGWNLKAEDLWVHHAVTNPSDGVAAIRAFGGGARGHLIQDCEVWRIGNGSTSGFNVPDAYQITASGGSVQTGSNRVRCIGVHAPDDTFDMFRANGCKDIDCVSYVSGRYWNGNIAGGGSGWKLGGGESGIGDNTVTGSLDILARREGLKPNNSPIGCEFSNSTCVDAEYYAFNLSAPIDPGQQHIARNNIAWNYDKNEGGDNLSYVDSSFNTWDSSPEPNPQFADPANYDWSLAAGSPCIGAGSGGTNQGASTVALERAKTRLPYILANS